MSKFLLVIILSFSPVSALCSWAAVIAALNTAGDALETVDSANEVASLFGEAGELKEMLEVLDATNDLAVEIGGEDELGDLAPTDLQRELKRINAKLADAGYAKNEIDMLLGNFQGDQRTVAGKIRTLRRSIRSMKNVRKSVSRLLGSKAADSVATQASAQIQTQNLHVNTKIYERMVVNDLNEKTKDFEAKKGREIVVEDMLIKLNNNLKNLKKKNTIPELKYQAIDMNMIKDISLPITGLFIALGGLLCLFINLTRLGVSIVFLTAISFFAIQLAPGLSTYAKKTVLEARSLH